MPSEKVMNFMFLEAREKKFERECGTGLWDRFGRAQSEETAAQVAGGEVPFAKRHVHVSVADETFFTNKTGGG